MSPLKTRNLSAQPFLLWVGFAVASLSLLAGCGRAERLFDGGIPGQEDRFVVHGFSMAPTLVGPSIGATCDRCNVCVQLPVADRRPDGAQPDRVGVCGMCGAGLRATKRQYPGDVVRRFTDQAEITRGCLVAIEGESGGAIKRVFAAPGDQVNLVDAYRLGVSRRDDNQLAVISPWVLVHQQTEWGDGANSLGPTNRWKLQQDSNGQSWMVYHHVNVHRGSMSSLVLDDYQQNVGVSRTLYPVYSLRVTGEYAGVDAGSVAVTFWQPDGLVRCDVPLDRHGRWDVASKDGKPSSGHPDNVVLDSTRPIAIRVIDETLQVKDVSVWRNILYRLRPSDDRSVYPIQLAADEFFVLGDNVPISIDSRDFGPITRDQIICGVEREVSAVDYGHGKQFSRHRQ